MELVIFVGLQGSGKTTFYHDRFAPTHAHVSKDNFRHNRNKNRRQMFLVETALREGRPVVVDNTNPTAADRAPLIALWHALGARVVGYYFESSLEDCLRRNRQRQGRARVPDEALYAFHRRLVPPSYAEGFDQLFRVRITEEGCEVREWPREYACPDSC